MFFLGHLQDAGAVAVGVFALKAQEGDPRILGKVDDPPE